MNERKPNIQCAWCGEYTNLAKLGLERGTNPLLCRAQLVYPQWALSNCHTKLDFIKHSAQLPKITNKSAASRKTQTRRHYFCPSQTDLQLIILRYLYEGESNLLLFALVHMQFVEIFVVLLVLVFWPTLLRKN